MRLIIAPNTILNRVCSPVEDPTNYTLFCNELSMFYSIQKNCVGLAAPQVGCNDRIFVAEGVVCINPKLLKTGATRTAMWESCMSIPHVRRLVVRNDNIVVEYFKSSGEMITKKLKGWSARVFQHELDHLNGILITEKPQ